ncbi:DUF4350 domain-containing protein [Flammeovirga yaeyamensis]|uniref:DUF4350 domain-containing protein n=1 Tax=Flammeovirga yaeyamensis TaxID=367791 RepID=A0AAX1NE78_9BACT|nr:DUF4350 domain-containing protein [Flammeovirga yaeyamensis]MBB3699518.1 hypothetical protein [Flammeovirga yaeyamensis]NMF35226.1 DUF4350 domain-containing protein [Flammeovirga yaeyamensis]QWG04088.1 DUF4350 domain-containing protein [Flammeovirga yaeyamensis]
MKKLKKHHIFLGVVVLLYLALTFKDQSQTDWTKHYKSNAKSPYGTKALTTLLDESEDLNLKVENSRLTIYELLDSPEFMDKGILLIQPSFSLDKTDYDQLYKAIEKGKDVFIAAEHFDYNILDTLRISAEGTYNIPNLRYIDNQEDAEAKIDSVDMEMNGVIGKFSTVDYHYYLSIDDSSTVERLAGTDDQNVFVKAKIGEGNLFLLSTPNVLSNFPLLHEENYLFVNEILKALPEGEYVRTEYYTLGREGQSTPLRVILAQQGLKESIFTLLLLIFVYLIFQSKREQRAIPTIEPPKNDSMAFVKTISQLYLNANDNKKILIKRKRFLFNHIRNKHYLDFNEEDNTQNIQLLAIRTGIDEEELRSLFVCVDREINYPMTASGFTRANQLIDEFYSKEQ